MKRQVPVGSVLLSFAAFVGCGGAAQALSVAIAPTNGFNGTVAVTIGSFSSDGTASPTTFSYSRQDARPDHDNGKCDARHGKHRHRGNPCRPSTTASLSTTSFDFGDNLVNNTLTQTVVVVTNTGRDILTLDPTLSGDPSYSIASGTSCTRQLAAGANCNVVVSYTPTTASAPAEQNATLNLGFGDVPAGTPQTVAITGIAAALAAGQVTVTDNPQVALYTMTLPFPGSMTVNFGTDTNYGLTTWTQSTNNAGGTVGIFVAGMQALTTYHMQAVVTFSNLLTTNDVDHTFTTKAVPPNMQLKATTMTTLGMTPQSGLELLDTLGGRPSGVIVTDLSGNVLWTYANPGAGGVTGVKMLPNGNFLMVLSTDPPPTSAALNEIREVNLAGDTVREISINDLNSELANASCAECHVTLSAFHHYVEPLPNGHWLFLASTVMSLSSTSIPPLTNLPPTNNVTGDVIIDVDENMQPVWVWNEFNHLDPNRHPYMFPDWTHTNAVVYSPDDGNILVSIRHQNWVIKVNYADGAGDGSILWHLGEGGDFTLEGGTAPTDWEYAQHYPAFFSPNTSGVFSLGVMDNGDDRIFPPGVTCGTSGAPSCLYTTIPVWQIDEGAKTATLTFHQILLTNLYSFFGGSVDLLANGNVEYDLCASGGAGGGSDLFEVTQESTPQTVWHMQVTGTNVYQGFRIPSLYPGVQW